MGEPSIVISNIVRVLYNNNKDNLIEKLNSLKPETDSDSEDQLEYTNLYSISDKIVSYLQKPTSNYSKDIIGIEEFVSKFYFEDYVPRKEALRELFTEAASLVVDNIGNAIMKNTTLQGNYEAKNTDNTKIISIRDLGIVANHLENPPDSGGGKRRKRKSNRKKRSKRSKLSKKRKRSKRKNN